MNDFKIGTLVEICKKLGLELEVNLGVIEDENEKEDNQKIIHIQQEWRNSSSFTLPPAILYSETNKERYLDA